MCGGLGAGWKEPPGSDETSCGERAHTHSVGRGAASYRIRQRDDRTCLLGVDSGVRIRELLEKLLKAQGSGPVIEAHRPHLLPGAVAHESAPVCGALQTRIVMHHGDTVSRGSNIGFEKPESQGGRVAEGGKGVLW